MAHGSPGAKPGQRGTLELADARSDSIKHWGPRACLQAVAAKWADPGRWSRMPLTACLHLQNSRLPPVAGGAETATGSDLGAGPADGDGVKRGKPMRAARCRRDPGRGGSAGRRNATVRQSHEPSCRARGRARQAGAGLHALQPGFQRPVSRSSARAGGRISREEGNMAVAAG